MDGPGFTDPFLLMGLPSGPFASGKLEMWMPVPALTDPFFAPYWDSSPLGLPLFVAFAIGKLEMWMPVPVLTEPIFSPYGDFLPTGASALCGFLVLLQLGNSKC